MRSDHKRLLAWFICGWLVVIAAFLVSPTVKAKEVAEGINKNSTVILLHGLARSSRSMRKMEKALQKAAFVTCNIAYPSTRYSIEILAKEHLLPKIKQCLQANDSVVHFVAHSMGGILVRYLQYHNLLSNLGRVVMLSPPNQGSEVVDRLGSSMVFRWVNGPAGTQLGTDDKSLPRLLGKADFDLGVITGNKSINWILSTMLPGDDDGKVSIAGAKLEGMQDFLIVPVSHPFMMKNKAVIQQTIHFLRYGFFKR